MAERIKRLSPRARGPAASIEDASAKAASKDRSTATARAGWSPAPVSAAPAEAKPTAPFQPVRAAKPHRWAAWSAGGAKPPPGIPPSIILSVLEPDRFEKIRAVRLPHAKVLWVNFELARELGFDVPSGNQMTPEFEEQLLDALAFRVLQEGEDEAGRATLEMYADRYAGTGITTNHGSARGAFFPYGNLFSKGVGLTPLFKPGHNLKHSTGAVSLFESVLEAAAGELSTNLFTYGSTRVLAVIDTGDFTEWEDGGLERNALVIRAGAHIRPAHFVEKGPQPSFSPGGEFSVPAFVRAAALNGELVTRPDPATREELPDLKATMLRAIDRQLKTTAEQIRMRVLHGATSTSNMLLDGGLVDLATFTTQERTAPVKVLEEMSYAFGTEHLDRALELIKVYKAMIDTLSPRERSRLHAVDLGADRFVEDRYHHHLRQELLAATGLKPELVERLVAHAPQTCEQLFQTLFELMQLRNPGELNVDKEEAKDLSVVDVFGLLQKLPEAYFHGRREELLGRAVFFAEARISGDAAQRSATAKTVDELCARCVSQYDQLMTAALSQLDGLYESPSEFRRSVQARARFENEPIPALARSQYRASFGQAIDSYLLNQDTDVFREAIDKAVASSVRSVEGLYQTGQRRALPGGGFELEHRVIDGIHYSVRGWKGEGSKRRLHLRIPVDTRGEKDVLELPGRPRLEKFGLSELRYRYTTDGWANWAEVPAEVTPDEEGHAWMEFDIPVLGATAGQLEGVFFGEAADGYWIKDGSSNFRGYPYAVPDACDFERLFVSQE